MATKKASTKKAKRTYTALEREALALHDKTLKAYEALAKKMDKANKDAEKAAAPFRARYDALGGTYSEAIEGERAALLTARNCADLGASDDTAYDSPRGIVADVITILTDNSTATRIEERDSDAEIEQARAAYIAKYGKPNRKTA